MEASARTLFRSLQRFRALPDHLQLWPGHGAGSACGKALGAMPSSTVGYERLGNWAVAATDEESFVRQVLEGQPVPPPYFAEMKRVNKRGPRALGHFQHPAHLPSTAAEGLVKRGALIIDTRATSDFAAGHLPGSLNIPHGGSFTRWAGWLAPYDRDVYLVVADRCTGCADAATRALAMIGHDQVAGILGDDALEKYAAGGRALATLAQASPVEVAAMLARGEVTVVDVRNVDEWNAGNLAGAPNLPLGGLAERIGEVPRDRPVVLHCQGGTRSVIAASVLQAHGVTNVIDMKGGYAAWREAGLPVSKLSS
jgi:hydroxyacylglutathione hydrolase